MKTLSALLFDQYRALLPPMSRTEREALEAGTVGWEGELFGGYPDWNKLMALPRPALSREEQSFLDHEVNEACRLVNDWAVTEQDHDLSPEAWAFLKSRGFLGLVIPERFGGRGFSAYAHSQIVARLSTRSSALAVSVMVPNSLGPGELLVHYGTPEQQQRLTLVRASVAYNQKGWSIANLRRLSQIK